MSLVVTCFSVRLPRERVDCRTWGMTSGAVRVPLRLFCTRCTRQKSSLRSSVSRPLENADIDPAQSAPGALAVARSPLESQRRQHSRPGSGPKPFLAEQGKGNAEIALLWF